MNLLDYSLKIGEEAYNQEKNREELIRERANYVFKWLTFIVSIFNIAVPLVVKETDIDYKSSGFVFLYIIMMLLLVNAIILIILIEFPKKKKYFPLGTDVLKRGKEEPDQYIDDVAIRYKSILYRDVLTKQLSINNDKAVKLLKGVYVDLVVSIVWMAIFFIYIVLR